MRLRLKDGKTKVLTLSYDDGVVQDIRLIEIMNQYGLKGTFNINTGCYLAEDAVRDTFDGRMKLSEAKALYTNSGHEVAVHGLTHPWVTKLDSAELIYQITEDRKNIEKEYGIIARGMAYPWGPYNESVADVLHKCGIVYARTAKSTHKFEFPDNWLMLHPTCHHGHQELDQLIHHFVENPVAWGNAAMFYLWGHSYEFDRGNNWHIIEKFAEYAGGREDIWYATNIEICDYVTAYNHLQTSYDKKRIHNPSAIDVWFEHEGVTACVKAGQTIEL